MKVCSRCKIEKGSTAFRQQGKYLRSWCKECSKEYHCELYRSNSKYRERILNRQRDRREQPGFKERSRKYHADRRKRMKREWISFFEDILGELRCRRCGFKESFVALEFHHIDPSKKEFMISQSWTKPISEESKALFSKELENIEILCSNCHRMLHWEDVC